MHIRHLTNHYIACIMPNTIWFDNIWVYVVYGDIWFEGLWFEGLILRSPARKRSILHYPPLPSTLTLSNNNISKIFLWINLWITLVIWCIYDTRLHLCIRPWWLYNMLYLWCYGWWHGQQNVWNTGRFRMKPFLIVMLGLFIFLNWMAYLQQIRMAG